MLWFNFSNVCIESVVFTQKMNNVYSICSVLQIVFSLGIVNILGICRFDIMIKILRESLEYEDLLIVVINGEEVLFWNRKTSKRYFEIKWVRLQR